MDKVRCSGVIPRIVVCAVLLFYPVLFAGAAERSVSVRETQLRESPGFLGRVLDVFAYGDRVEVLSEQDGWSRVRSGSLEGWVHTSALTTKRIVLEPGDSDAREAATSREVALAGRGFNRQVEERYKSETGLDFAYIDRIEGYGMDTEALLVFLREGGVSPAEGGR
jgi:hypothetical protein